MDDSTLLTEGQAKLPFPPSAQRPPHFQKVASGLAGWGPGQLEAEMAADIWIIEPARVEDVFTDAPDLLWRRVLERKGPEYRTLSRMPYDPSMN